MITLSCNTVCYLSLYYASLRSCHKWISFISVINKPKKEKKRKTFGDWNLVSKIPLSFLRDHVTVFYVTLACSA